MQTHPRSRDVILREEEFASMLAGVSQGFGGSAIACVSNPARLHESDVALHLAEAAHRLETFLDDHGARHNRTFATFGEVVASTRGLAVVRSTGQHLLNRLGRYDTLGDDQELVAELAIGLRILDEALVALLQATIAESAKLGFTWNPVGGAHDAAQSPQRKLLPRNLDADVAVDEKQHIGQIGVNFLKVLEASRQLGLNRVRAREDLAEYVSKHATEERCRWYESSVHNIQSMYDTYVLRTAIERDSPWLQKLRGHASIAFHLLEMATGLVHFYERHENDIRHESVRAVISEVVSKESILDVAVNICLRQAYFYVEEAAPLAERILGTFVSSDTVDLVLPEGLVLHARPLALIVQVVRHYGTPVEITIEGESCSGNSLMSLILLAGRHPQPRVVQARGDSAVLRDLSRLFEAGLGEGGAELIEELGYLRSK